jgi:hypothetical protein
MEELKQQNKQLANGNKSFSMQRAWLQKLKREAMAENKEFWYLKFSFGEDTLDTYITVEEEVIMSMVSTMISDRKDKKIAEQKSVVANNRIKLLEVEVAKLQAELDLIKSEKTLERLEDNEQSNSSSNSGK